MNIVENEEDVKLESSPCRLGRKLTWDTRLNWTSVGILVPHEVIAGSYENDVLSHTVSAV